MSYKFGDGYYITCPEVTETACTLVDCHNQTLECLSMCHLCHQPRQYSQSRNAIPPKPPIPTPSGLPGSNKTAHAPPKPPLPIPTGLPKSNQTSHTPPKPPPPILSTLSKLNKTTNVPPPKPPSPSKTGQLGTFGGNDSKEKNGCLKSHQGPCKILNCHLAIAHSRSGSKTIFTLDPKPVSNFSHSACCDMLPVPKAGCKCINANVNAGERVHFNLIERGDRPWTMQKHDVRFVRGYASPQVTLRKLMRSIFWQDDVENEWPTIVEVHHNPKNQPQWTRGHTYFYHSRASNHTLKDLGWPVTRNNEKREPVWLAFGLGHPDQADD